MTNKEASDLQEKEIAQWLGGKVQAASGGTTFGGGDIHTEYFFIEAKTTTTPKKSYSVKADVLAKMRTQALEQRKPYSALAFRFEPNGRDFYVIDARLMAKLVKFLEEE